MTAFTVVFLSAIVYVIFWFVVAFMFKGGLEEWAKDMRAGGYRISHSEPVLGGFPFRVRLSADKPEVTAPDGAWSWSGQRARIEAQAWRPDLVEVALEGGHRFTFPGPGGAKTYRGGGAIGAVLDFDLSVDGPAAAEIRIRDLDLAAAGKAASKPASIIAARRADLTLARYPDGDADYRTPTFDLRFDGEGMTVPRDMGLPLGHVIESLSFEAGVLGPVGPGSWPDSLAVWRDLGGTVEVRDLRAVYGPMTIKASGTMAVDAEVQPIGAFTAKVQGFFEIIDTLKRHGLVGGADAMAAKLLLGVMSRRPEGGGPPALNLAITIQDQKLFAGPVKLADIPTVKWPAVKWDNSDRADGPPSSPQENATMQSPEPKGAE